jgi:hypothetical protein
MRSMDFFLEITSASEGPEFHVETGKEWAPYE